MSAWTLTLKPLLRANSYIRDDNAQGASLQVGMRAPAVMCEVGVELAMQHHRFSECRQKLGDVDAQFAFRTSHVVGERRLLLCTCMNGWLNAPHRHLDRLPV